MYPGRLFTPFVVACSLLIATHGFAEKKSGYFDYEDKNIAIHLSHPTPEQISAFYMGRGFKQSAIDVLAKACFISVRMKNKGENIVWLELDNWSFHKQNRQPIERINRKAWQEKWQSIGLSLAHQSTFGWTQLPEQRDLRPDEPVGGNVVIPWQEEPFTLIARFNTGADKSGPSITLTFENQKCASNQDKN